MPDNAPRQNLTKGSDREMKLKKRCYGEHAIITFPFSHSLHVSPPFFSVLRCLAGGLGSPLWGCDLGGQPAGVNMEETGHMGETVQGKWMQRFKERAISVFICSLPLSDTHRLGYICAPSPLSPGQGRGLCPGHLTQGKGCICWEGGDY